jgi:hypothetical protein
MGIGILVSGYWGIGYWGIRDWVLGESVISCTLAIVEIYKFKTI